MTNEVLDDWLAQNLGIDLNNVPLTKPAEMPVILRRKEYMIA